jgi:hypothetical protein
VWFNEGTRKGSVLKHALIRAGGGDNPVVSPPLVQGCITVTKVPDATIHLEQVELEGCVNAGVVLERSLPEIAALTIRKTSAGLLLDGVSPGAWQSAVAFVDVKQSLVIGSARRTSN